MGWWCGVVDEGEDASTGDSRENSRTMESSSMSGKESSSSSSSSPSSIPSSKEESSEEQEGLLGAAAGGGGFCVRSKEKSRSWDEISERR